MDGADGVVDLHGLFDSLLDQYLVEVKNLLFANALLLVQKRLDLGPIVILWQAWLVFGGRHLLPLDEVLEFFNKL